MSILLIIDTHALLHRAFHALPQFTSPHGAPVGALYGVAKMVMKMIRAHNPHYIAATGDSPEPTFRKKQFDAYKAHRPPTPPELISQITAMRELFSVFHIPFFEIPGFEADDLIGTLVTLYKTKNDIQIIIITGDLDALQLVEGDRVLVETPQRSLHEALQYNEAAVFKRYSLTPSQIPDFKGLVGDASDNIPGIPGIGQKTATKILQAYHTLQIFFASHDALAQKYKTYQTQALLSKHLATIRTDAPLSSNLNDLEFRPPEEDVLRAYFLSLGFKSLVTPHAATQEKPTLSLFS